MIIGDRLRALREEKKLSQGDIEKRTGLLRCYISRVENGHTVPAIETLEKLARALECPLYQLFYDGEEPPQLPNLPKRKSSDDIAWGSVGKEARFLNKLRRLLSKVEDEDRKLIMYMAQKMANRGNSDSLLVVAIRLREQDRRGRVATQRGFFPGVFTHPASTLCAPARSGIRYDASEPQPRANAPTPIRWCWAASS